MQRTVLRLRATLTNCPGRTVTLFTTLAVRRREVPCALRDCQTIARHTCSRSRRSSSTEALIGDASKARELLGWKAETNADRLAQIMVDADIEQMRHLLRD